MMLGMNEWNDCKPEDLLYIYIYVHIKNSLIYTVKLFIYIYLNDVHKNNKYEKRILSE